MTETDHYTTIQGVRESTKENLNELRQELHLTRNGVLVHLYENKKSEEK